MYCPQCATPHTDGAKFCRSCGIELETVALVISGKSVPPAAPDKNRGQPKTAQEWLEKRIEGVSGLTKGAILLTVSVLIGLALALFVPSDVPWILVWMVFFGWMAGWGGIEMAQGLGFVIEAKNRLRLMKLSGQEPAIVSPPQQLSTANEQPIIANHPAAFDSSPPLSVTEVTTRQLDDVGKQ